MTVLQSSRGFASLLAPELLHEMLSQLPLRAVAAAAITCRGWQETALDILWRDVNLVDLLNVLSPTEERTGEDEQPELHFLRAITPGGWLRFHSLAFRIRRGKLHKLLHSSLVAEVYMSSSNRSPLLPAIAHVDLRTRTNGHAMLFMGPTLHTLHLEIIASGNPFAAPQLLVRIPIFSPLITQVYLVKRHEEGGHDFTQDVVDLSRSLRGLRFIDVHQLDVTDEDPIISALAGCPFLEEMVLWGSEEDMRWPSTDEEPFRSLRRVTVMQSSDPVFASFLNSLPSTLTHVQYKYDDCSPTIGDFDQVMVAVARHQQLESLVITESWTTTEDISPQLLQPLHVCSRLRVLSMAMGGSVKMTDEDIAQLTSHFPRLQDFKLKGFRDTLASLQALAIIVTSCPMIQTISLEMDTSRAQLPSTPSFPASQFLRRVDVQKSLVSDVRSVALFFGAWWTSKDFELTHGLGHNDYGAAEWNSVETLARSLQKSGGHTAEAEAEAAAQAALP